MPRLLRMPEVAANTTEAILIGWPVPVDGAFKARDAIATVETAKAVVDVEADSDGVLVATLAAEGAEVPIGAPIALLADPGERVPDVAAALAALGVTEPAAAPNAAEAAVAPNAAEAAGAPGTAEAAGADARTAAPSIAVTPGIAGSSRTFASPLARRLAREAGLVLADLTGTGPHERIVRRDVEAAIARRNGHHAPELIRTAAAQVAVSAGEASESYVDTPHSRIRRAIATRLTESKLTAPHFYLRAVVRAEALTQLRTDVNASGRYRISLTDLIVKAVACAHQRVPAMNVIWLPEAIRTFSNVDVAVAVATESGLVTPVLRSVNTLSVSAIANGMGDLVERARRGALTQPELEGGSITVTNLGMYDVAEFAAIINPPQAAILAVGAVRDEPIVDGGQLTAARVMHVTLSVDHRPVDGVVAAQWMKALVDVLQHPLELLI
jgi:pyruvate dehydrogenase E2 component (dihydrolipoyllysine-residue acetyltransferase)